MPTMATTPPWCGVWSWMPGRPAAAVPIATRRVTTRSWPACTSSKRTRVPGAMPDRTSAERTRNGIVIAPMRPGMSSWLMVTWSAAGSTAVTSPLAV